MKQTPDAILATKCRVKTAEKKYTRVMPSIILEKRLLVTPSLQNSSSMPIDDIFFKESQDLHQRGTFSLDHS